MTKEEIIKAIWNQFPDITLQKAKLVYENTMNLIRDELAKGESVEIRGFGKFNVRKKNQRVGRNPRNGEEAMIKERKVVAFKPSKIFREQVMEEHKISD
ncbi:MAG: integration host factor subunit alpha [Spirochaetota bacterium]